MTEPADPVNLDLNRHLRAQEISEQALQAAFAAQGLTPRQALGAIQQQLVYDPLIVAQIIEQILDEPVFVDLVAAALTLTLLEFDKPRISLQECDRRLIAVGDRFVYLLFKFMEKTTNTIYERQHGIVDESVNVEPIEFWEAIGKVRDAIGKL